MITGDNILTAQAIAHSLGIEGDAVQGLVLDNGPDIKKLLKKTNIFARVNPEHKQQIITALKEM
jgi:Ca2+-transporting ATPase